MEPDIIEVMEEEWDYLFILDACRYDYFSSIYENYFYGELKKGTSVGSSTPEWCRKSFHSFYSDIIYISGNPWINSKLVFGFDTRRHFCKVIDVWDFGWNTDLSTVPPIEINKSTLGLLKKFPEKRFIIHYLQPHEPYLSSKFIVKDLLKHHKHKQARELLMEFTHNQRGYVSEIIKPFGRLYPLLTIRNKIIKNKWKIRDLLNLPPKSPMDAMRRKYGIVGLRKAYEENLGIVLYYASILCNKILDLNNSKSIVITSDHGELLGEGGNFSHRHGSNDSILLDIPFLRVANVK